MHRGAVLGRTEPRLFDSHSSSSLVGFSTALAGSGGRGMVAPPHAVLALNLLLLGVGHDLLALFT